MRLWLDLETFNETPIANGTYAYAIGAEIMLFAYAIDDGPVSVWDLTADPEMPFDLEDALENCDEVWAHNSMFDRNVMACAMPDKCPPLSKWRDTMVKALSHSLPGKLDTLCEIFGISEEKAKLKEGRALVMLFCKPLPKNSKLRRATRLTHPEKWARFVAYAGNDIVSMREIDKKLPSWNYTGRELELWHLDQRINDRGMYLDTDLVAGALRAVADAQKELAARTMELTHGQVTSATKRDKMLDHILEYYGVAMADLQGATVQRRIEDPDLPWALKELLQVRLQATTSSTSKYAALSKGISPDHRLRGTKQFNGANRTGRWAGRLFQPDNLPRPDMDYEDIEQGIEAIKAGCADLVFDNVMRVCSNAIRGCIAAPEGKLMYISDLANIEGRDAAWLAGEQWKLEAFQAYDDKVGHDLYALAYAKSFGVTPESVMADKKAGGNQRQIGKVQELALGFAGGVGAFVTFALAYKIDLEELPDLVFPNADPDLVEEARGFYEWLVVKKRGADFGLTKDAYVACEVLKRAWRNAHPAISSYWKQLEETVRDAIRHPGVTFPCRKVKIRRDGAWLRIVLPSGRALCYAKPQVDDKGQISYMGVNQYTRKWQRVKSFGGKFFENMCQAVARDVLAHNMPAIEAAGYEIVLTVHDEVVTEAPATDEYSSDELSGLLAASPPWAAGMPLAAAGFSFNRYKKDD